MDISEIRSNVVHSAGPRNIIISMVLAHAKCSTEPAVYWTQGIFYFCIDSTLGTVTRDVLILRNAKLAINLEIVHRNAVSDFLSQNFLRDENLHLYGIL